MQSKTVTLESIFKSEIPIKDKFWFLCRKVATKEQNQKIAIDLAEVVLPIYESQYPENKAPREAIESAKLFIAGHLSLEELMIKRRAAANAAYASAYASANAAAYASAYAAAYASDDDDYDAADAAYATANAADNASAYASATAIKKQIENYLMSLLNLMQ